MDFRLRFFQLLLIVIRMTPSKLVPLLADVLTFIALKFAKKDKAIAQKNIKKIWNLPAGTTFSNMFLKQVFRHQIVSALESVKGIDNPELIKIEGADQLKEVMNQAEASESGQVFITGHMGSWELTGLFAARATKVPFYALAKPAKYQKITDYLSKIRKKAQINVLWTNEKDLFRSMVTVVNSGEWLSFVMDQKPDNRKGALVQFFGQPIDLVKGPAAMATKFQTPVVAVFCMRVGPFHYRIHSKTLLQANHGEDDNVKVCQIMAGELERVIRLYPEQWCWNYKRWKF